MPAIIFSVLIIPFIMCLPNSEGRHIFFLTMLISFSSIIQMFCLCNLFLPVDFLVMRLICLISRLLAQYYASIIISFKMGVRTSFYQLLYSSDMERFSYLDKEHRGYFVKVFTLSLPYNCITKISY